MNIKKKLTTDKLWKTLTDGQEDDQNREFFINYQLKLMNLLEENIQNLHSVLLFTDDNPNATKEEYDAKKKELEDIIQPILSIYTQEQDEVVG